MVHNPPASVKDARAWQANTIDPNDSWYYPLSETCLATLHKSVLDFRQHPRPVTSFELSKEQRAQCRDCIQPALTALEKGRGFAIIDRVPLQRYSATESQLIYWLVGQLLGEPVEQNVQGMLLYDVRDTGQNLSQGARFSVTNYETSFHTDNSFGQDVLDYVGLLCLNTAKTGGLSQVLSGVAVYQDLSKDYPDVLSTLSEPFHVDRRGGTREGESATIRFPVVKKVGNEILFRYLRYWIEVGHEKVYQPLSTAQLTALDTLDEILRRRELRVDFALERGQMFFINNRWILHNRTAFEDHAEPERQRHYVRLWLRAKP